MSKLTLHPMIKRIRGKMDHMVFRLTPSGEMALSKLPDMSKVKWSDAQKEHRERFKEAVGYAKVAMADEKVRRIYEKAAKKQGKRPFDLAVSDYFKGKNLLNSKNK